MTWSAFWTVVFFASFSGFVSISLLIAVKGVGEIKELLRTLHEGDAKE